MELKNKAPLSLFLFAFILSALTMPEKLSVTYDEALYMDIARNLAQNLGNFTYRNTYMMYRPPVYPYTLSTLYRLLPYEHHMMAARLTSVFFYALTTALVYRFARKLGLGEWQSIAGALFYVLNPIAFATSNRALVHAQFTFLYTLTIYLFYTGRKEEPRLIYIAFATAALTILTRYTGLSIVGVMLAYLWLVDDWEWLKWKEYYIGAGVFVLVLLPWLYMGHIHYGGAFQPFEVASRVVTLDRPSSAFNYLKDVMIALTPAFVILTFLGFIGLKKDDSGWLLVSWGFIGLMGILTVVHKEVRFITFLSPVIAILSAMGVGLIHSHAGKYEKDRVIRGAITLGIVLLLFTPFIGEGIRYKEEQWDRMWLTENRVVLMASEYGFDSIIVSGRLYTLAGFYYPEAEVDQLVNYPKMRRNLERGHYDIVIYREGDPLWEYIERGNYTATAKYGPYTILTREEK